MGTLLDLNELAAANLAANDLLLIRDISDVTDKDKKIQAGAFVIKNTTTTALANRVASWKDANTLQDSGVDLADVARRGVANAFTAANTYSALQTFNGGIVPGSGQDTINVFKKGSWPVAPQNHGSATFSVNSGDYIRIGASSGNASLVFFSIVMQGVLAGSGAGAVRLSLPFTVVTPVTISPIEHSLVDLAGTGATGAVFETEVGFAQGILRVLYDNASFNNILGSSLLANCLLRISGFYFA